MKFLDILKRLLPTWNLDEMVEDAIEEQRIQDLRDRAHADQEDARLRDKFFNTMETRVLKAWNEECERKRRTDGKQQNQG